VSGNANDDPHRPRLLGEPPPLGVSKDTPPSTSALVKHAVLGFQVFRSLLPVAAAASRQPARARTEEDSSLRPALGVHDRRAVCFRPSRLPAPPAKTAVEFPEHYGLLNYYDRAAA